MSYVGRTGIVGAGRKEQGVAGRSKMIGVCPFDN